MDYPNSTNNSTPPNEVEPKGETVNIETTPEVQPRYCGNNHDFVEDPSDQTEFYIAVICTLCHRGYLKRKA